MADGSSRAVGSFSGTNEMIKPPEEILELQCNLVIRCEVIFKHGIDTTLLNIGSGQAWPGSQQR